MSDQGPLGDLTANLTGRAGGDYEYDSESVHDLLAAQVPDDDSPMERPVDNDDREVELDEER